MDRSARFLVAATCIVLSLLAGCTSTTTRKLPAQPDQNLGTATPESSLARDPALLKYSNYDEYCLITPEGTYPGRARILAIPKDLTGDSLDTTTSEGWPTRYDAELVKVIDPDAESNCRDLGYMNRSPSISISDDESGQRWLHFTMKPTDELMKTIHRRIYPYTPASCPPGNPNCGRHPIWYQSNIENGIQFFVYMEAKNKIADKYPQHYRVEVFQQPDEKNPDDPNRSCWEHRPQLNVTVFPISPTNCQIIKNKENGVGAGNEPR